jgi:hypothetical protein
MLLCICLLPYLISSVYSVASTLLNVPAATRWLWGDWLSTVIAPDGMAYRLVVEAPVCCVGALGLLIAILGIVWLVSGRVDGEPEAAVETYEADIPPEDVATEPVDEPVVPDIDRATW